MTTAIELVVTDMTLLRTLPTHSIGPEIYPLIGVLLGSGLYLDCVYTEGHSQRRRYNYIQALAAVLAARVQELCGVVQPKGPTTMNPQMKAIQAVPQAGIQALSTGVFICSLAQCTYMIAGWI
jgi:hypothetical protein